MLAHSQLNWFTMQQLMLVIQWVNTWVQSVMSLVLLLVVNVVVVGLMLKSFAVL
ncbi:hypothetical protein D3C76_1462710 [compost metagenome]